MHLRAAQVEFLMGDRVSPRLVRLGIARNQLLDVLGRNISTRFPSSLFLHNQTLSMLAIVVLGMRMAGLLGEALRANPWHRVSETV